MTAPTPRASCPSPVKASGIYAPQSVLSRQQQSAKDRDSRQWNEKFQQVQSKLVTLSVEFAEHREDMEQALARLVKDGGPQAGGLCQESLMKFAARMEDLEMKVSRASELSCDVYDQQVEFQKQCDTHFSTVQRSLTELQASPGAPKEHLTRSRSESTPASFSSSAPKELRNRSPQNGSLSFPSFQPSRSPLEHLKGLPSRSPLVELHSVVAMLRPELSELLQGRPAAPEEVSSSTSGYSANEGNLGSAVCHAELLRFADSLLRRLSEGLLLRESMSSGVSAGRKESLLSDASDGLNIEREGAFVSAIARDAEAVDEDSLVTPEHKLALPVGFGAFLDPVYETSCETSGAEHVGSEDANSFVMKELAHAQTQACEEVLAVAVHVRREIDQELANSIKRFQKTSEVAASCQIGHDANFLTEGLEHNTEEISELRTMLGGTRRRICDTNRTVARIVEELQSTDERLQELGSECNARSASVPSELVHGTHSLTNDLVQTIRNEVVAELNVGITEGGRKHVDLRSATREAHRDLEVLRDEIGKRVEEEHIAVNGVREAIANAQANIYHELDSAFERRFEAVKTSAKFSAEDAESIILQLLADERRLASPSRAHDASYGERSCVKDRSETQQELVNTAEALQAIGLEMCESQGRVQEEVRREAHRVNEALALQHSMLAEEINSLASRMDCEDKHQPMRQTTSTALAHMRHELADAKQSHHELACALQSSLAESDVRHSSVLGEAHRLSAELQTLQNSLRSFSWRAGVIEDSEKIGLSASSQARAQYPFGDTTHVSLAPASENEEIATGKRQVAFLGYTRSSRASSPPSIGLNTSAATSSAPTLRGVPGASQSVSGGFAFSAGPPPPCARALSPRGEGHMAMAMGGSSSPRQASPSPAPQGSAIRQPSPPVLSPRSTVRAAAPVTGSSAIAFPRATPTAVTAASTSAPTPAMVGAAPTVGAIPVPKQQALSNSGWRSTPLCAWNGSATTEGFQQRTMREPPVM